jgi:homoserine kinase type II
VGDYTKLPNDEAQAILALYGLGSPIRLRALSLGISNSNYDVETPEGRFLLKVSNDKNRDQVSKEMSILALLKKKAFPFSLVPIKTADGEELYNYGRYFGVLFPFVEGIPPGPSDFTCREIGKGIASLHNLKWTPSELATVRQQEDVGFPPAALLSFVKSSGCPLDFREEFHACFPDSLHGFLKEELDKGIVHGDLYYDNTLFSHNTLAVMLDFEQAGVGEMLLDLGICISGTCLEKGRIINPLIDSLISGYEEVRPLPPNERSWLREAILLGLFSIALWRIKRFKEGNLNPMMADSYKDLLARAKTFRVTGGQS